MHTPYVYVREAVLQLQFGVLNTYYLDLLIDTEVSYRNQIARQAKLYAHIVASPKFSPPRSNAIDRGVMDPVRSS